MALFNRIAWRHNDCRSSRPGLPEEEISQRPDTRPGKVRAMMSTMKRMAAFAVGLFAWSAAFSRRRRRSRNRLYP